jgi:biopolymer transport protein ExbD
MAQGHGGEGEPNLIPLLDLVLQLIMFFMITVNFIRVEQLAEEVLLPVAQDAVPMDRTADNWVFLNMDKEGNIVNPPSEEDSPANVLGKEQLPGKDVTLGKIQVAVARVRDSIMRETRQRDPDAPPPNIVIVLRAHRDAPYKAVWDVLDTCRKAGYERWQLRVLHKK